MTDQQALHAYADRRDAEAFRVLVEQYQRLVYAAASRRLVHTHDVEDVVQLTFLKLARSAGAIRRNLAAWLHTTAINTANDLIRRDQTRRRHEQSAAVDEPFVHDAEREEWRRLSPIIDEVLLELSEPKQLLIVEHFLRGRSQRDLAEQLDVSQPTVLRRINSAIDALRERLAARGYTGASPLLLTTLGKIPATPIPAAVTRELVKVGLSGASAGTGPVSASVFGAIWMKLGLGVVALAALIVGGVVLLPTTPGPSPLGAAPSPAPVAPTSAPAIDPNDWRAAFNAAYALQPNQNLKYIPPPPLPERQRYLSEVEHNDSPMPFIQWQWINGSLKRQWMQGSGPDGASLGSVLAACANLDGHHIAVDDGIRINADGDWIVRDSASTEAILTDLRTILNDQFKTDVRFEKQEETKEALIATGRYRLKKLPNTTGGLQIYTDVLDHPQPGDSIQGGGTTSPAEMWTMLGGIVGIPVVDETTGAPKKVGWMLSRSITNAATDPARRQQILDNITAQTGVAFKQEKRTFTTWKVTQEAGAKQ